MRTTMNGKPVFTVPAKTIINFKSHFDKKLLCDGMTFTAGDACAYSCAFCYVEAMQNKRQAWLEAHGVTGEHMDHVVRRESPVAILRQQIMSKPEAFRSKQQVIYSSPLVDVAANMDLVRETVEICKVILELTNWHIRLLSKSNLLPKVAQSLYESVPTAPNWKHLWSKERIIYGVSTGTLDDQLAAAFEAGTPKVSKRIESLHWLQDNGFRTFGMICPSLPQADYLAFSRDMARAIRVEKCESCWTEVINVRGDSFLNTYCALENAGFIREAGRLAEVSSDKGAWEAYARATFSAHAEVLQGQKSPDGSPKLKHLQYVTNASEAWWKNRECSGAVLL